MPTVEITGKIIRKFDTKVISDRFQKREFVLHVEEKYPQELLLQLVQSNCDVLDNFSEGDMVDTRVAIEGRSWQRSPSDPMRWFNSLKVFSMKHAESQQGAPAGEDIPPPPPPPEADSAADDNLPF